MMVMSAKIGVACRPNGRWCNLQLVSEDERGKGLQFCPKQELSGTKKMVGAEGKLAGAKVVRELSERWPKMKKKRQVEAYREKK